MQSSVLTLATLACAGAAQAQAPTAEPAEGTVENIAVLGSQIRGAKTTGALPVSVINQEAMQAVAPVDLFHEADRIEFKPGDLNRRINVTMLYGRRTWHGN